MIRQILPISSLLLGSAFLLFAGGINALILPVRGTAEGFTPISLGLLGTGWAIGYVAGCLMTPRLVAQVGHIRAFSVMAAFAAIAILASLLLLSPWAWIPLRGLSGFCFAGAAMIVESWLSDRAASRNRGRIFGIYTMVNLVASTGGQLALTLGDTQSFLFFVLAAMFYCLALVPTATTSSSSPKPLVKVRLDLIALWRNSPVALASVFLIGISNGSFGAMAPVYANEVGLNLTAVALFASLPILAGAVSQVPVGIWSDRGDRRKVLVGLAIAALAVDVAFLALMPEGRWTNLALSCLFGAAIYAMYPVILAHAQDHAAEGSSIQTSGGLLMVFGIGSIVGPLATGLSMTTFGPTGLFGISAMAHVAMIGFALWRIAVRAPVASDSRSPFVMSPRAGTATPETQALAKGEDEDTGPAPQAGIATP